MAVHIGIGLFTAQVPSGSDRTFEQEYRETLDLVRLAEAVGFDSVWVSEHHGASDGYLPSLFVLLGAMAAATTTIRLGTGVVLTPLHDPIRLAEDAAVVDQLSGGRLTVGLGLGWREEEFRMLRIPFAERLARHTETVEILRRAWSGERFSFSGEVFDLDRVRVSPPPAQAGGPPIVLGGYVDAALLRVGATADGYITDADDAGFVRHALTLMEEGARGAGRDPSSLGLVLMQNVWVQEGGDPWATIEAGVVHQWGSYGAWAEGHDTPEHDTLEPWLDDLAEARRATPHGSPEEVLGALRRTVAAFGDRPGGLDLVVRLHYPGMDLDTAARAVELFAERVIPGLKGS
jgi:probable F420-dependent oxidoreductase